MLWWCTRLFIFDVCLHSSLVDAARIGPSVDLVGIGHHAVLGWDVVRRSHRFARLLEEADGTDPQIDNFLFSHIGQVFILDREPFALNIRRCALEPTWHDTTI